MKKNYLLRTLIISAIVIILLFIAFLLTPFSIGDYTIKKVDILSDLRVQDSVKQENKKPEDALSEKNILLKDSCGIAFTCVEDFSADHSSMKHFYSVLDSVALLNRPVRIAFFGDSFIESDIITGDVREQLQQIYGGCGVGFVPLTSVAPGYRKTVYHGFQNFTTLSLLKNQYDIGISGYGYRANENASVSYKGVNYKENLDKFSVVRLIYKGKKNIFASYSINQQKSSPLDLFTEQDVCMKEIKDTAIHSVAFTFSPSMQIYGVYLDCNQGIAVDNFAVRGHSGMNLLQIDENILRQTNSLIPYDLIVLQYGLNVAGAKTTNYDHYKAKMVENVAHIKRSFPNTSILLMSVGDRNTRHQGKYVTMDGIRNLIPVQQEIASESQIAFWNTFEAMGGEAGMSSFVNANPPLAAKDYTHLNHEGGKKIATEFVNALLYGKRYYDLTKKKDETVSTE